MDLVTGGTGTEEHLTLQLSLVKMVQRSLSIKDDVLESSRADAYPMAFACC